MAAPAIAVFCSGRGTNLQAILDAARQGRLRARVALVVSDNPGAYALERARRAKVPQVVVADPRRFRSREAYDRALARLVDASGARLVVLAGWMRLLSRPFVRRCWGRILNVHPALLPSFPGVHAVRDALRHGVKVTGVTVHLVDEQIDHGPILLQEAVEVKPKDTEKTLHERIHRVEHRLYPRAIQQMLSQKGSGRPGTYER
ncbi:MAG: phosphoribosylglycinamide formyltransferase [Candidatus Omnitrophica bacterium]|nr:phosphoribosylglycinamide formyltransferase [Candidatus Omnitrophota bacterium]